MPPVRLLTVGSLPPEMGGPARGGVATFHATLLEGLLDRADEVEVVGVLPPGPLGSEPPVPSFPRPSDTPLPEFYARLLVQLKPDVVLMNHVAHTIGVTHARLRDAPPAIGVIHSWHNITFAAAGEEQRAREVTETALSGLAALVAPSYHCLREGQALGLPYPPVAEVIHYPLQPLYLADDIDVDARPRRGVTFLGSLIPRKNPEALVEAAALLPGMEVRIVGDGELAHPLEDLIARRSLDDRVTVTSLPDDRHLERVRDLLLRSEAMCLPSRSESFGLVFTEALACGTPVVGFGPTLREIRDKVGIDTGVALDGDTPEGIAAGIAGVLERDWDRVELRRRTVDAFGLRQATARYLDLLRRASGNR